MKCSSVGSFGARSLGSAWPLPPAGGGVPSGVAGVLPSRQRPLASVTTAALRDPPASLGTGVPDGPRRSLRPETVHDHAHLQA